MNLITSDYHFDYNCKKTKKFFFLQKKTKQKMVNKINSLGEINIDLCDSLEYFSAIIQNN